jgi:flagellar hook assembly protein FlgD
MVKALRGQTVTFTIAAADSDGDVITSLTMVKVKMPAGDNATFTPNATNTGGTFTWTNTTTTGNYQVQFIARNALSGSATTSIQIKKSGVIEAGADAIGVPVLAMSQASPNPSANEVSFVLDLPEASDVDLGVYDMQGRSVYREVRSMSAGRSSWSWNGLNSGRQRVGTGMYFVRAKVGETVMLRRVIRF